MKTATVQQVPEQWPDILKWVVAGEEVQMTDHDKVVAKLVPATVLEPDFLNRAKAVWGENPSGKALSEFVAEAGRGQPQPKELTHELRGFHRQKSCFSHPCNPW